MSNFYFPLPPGPPPELPPELSLEPELPSPPPLPELIVGEGWSVLLGQETGIYKWEIALTFLEQLQAFPICKL